jgi:hypothetical protein
MKILTEEHKRKIGLSNSIALRGRKLSIEHKKNLSIARMGKSFPRLNGGKMRHSKGYVFILNHDHPFSNSRGYVQEHRLVIEKQIGRYLHRWEVVHHINKIRDDNRYENLMVFKTDQYHKKFESGKEIEKDKIIFDGRVINGDGVSSH